MATTLYFIRHAHSPKGNELEHLRELSEQGIKDAIKINEFIHEHDINDLYTSPFKRAIQTFGEVSGNAILIEDLKECVFHSTNQPIENSALLPLVEQMFLCRDFRIYDGETFNECQKRIVNAIHLLLENHKDEKIAVCSHGLVMTAFLNYYDAIYDFAFLNAMSKPDIYELVFNEGELVLVQRVWGC